MNVIAIDPASATLRSIHDPEPIMSIEPALDDLRIALDDAVSNMPDLRSRIWARIEAQIETSERNDAIQFERVAS
jgi:hypothetical protein